MSALRRSGYGPSEGPPYGRYYGPGGGDVPVHPPPPLYSPRSEPPQPPVPWRVRGGGPTEPTWQVEGGGGDSYYPSGGAWPEPGRTAGSHQSLNYTNGAYGPPYPPGPGANTASYSGTYYAPGYTQTNYSTDVPNTYRSPGNSPTPVSHWMYPQQDCQTEVPPLRGQVPGYPSSQNPGVTLPHYSYGDGNRSIPQSGPSVRPQEDAWASPGAYAMGTRYPWPTGTPSAPPGNLYMTESASSWPNSGSPQTPLSPPPHQSKDSSYPYSQSDQGMNRHNFPCSVHQYDSSGTMNNNSDLLDSQVQYSAEPQLYDNATNENPSHQDQSTNHPEECLSSDEGTPPSIKKIINVLEKVQYLEQEVEEFVGKKTDKAYWLLEEMLTKELLELDSVETGGQDSVRQARKEAVCKIQAILEKLEKKGL
ncbi:PREDICTED: BAG family molecular chaperone regulator 4 isoform X2 [Chrysochloris asiatica]|uniref:BAG family molecular chaperone regulator 4 n=1 Tax=Chrysochloris asiatica TaxID=185453 RepID=A0A9B0TEW5_CHRAS|nr:PREDICTED: BAG family molecular chaperone regulator 4 isoform X2 [Chrysochloris asiatica]